MGKRGRPVQRVGSMRQRSSGAWELRAYAGVDARTGRERYVTRTVHGSRSAAARGLRELVAVAHVAHVGPTVGASASFATLVDSWLAAKEPRWSPTTLSNTRSPVKCHLMPRLGSVPVGAVSTAQIDELLADLGRAGLSAGSVNLVRSIIHAALAQAVRWDWTRVESGVIGRPSRGGTFRAFGSVARCGQCLDDMETQLGVEVVPNGVGRRGSTELPVPRSTTFRSHEHARSGCVFAGRGCEVRACSNLHDTEHLRSVDAWVGSCC